MLLLVFLLAFFAPVCLGDHLTETYPFNTTLSEGYYYLFWNFSTTDETIQFAVRVKTTGWVGFGISPNGQMPGSDVIIGWIDGQKSYFNDRYALGRYEPPIDNMQDWFLISARQDDGYTELEFSRNFTTCDNESEDIDILADTARIVYSWNDELPTVTQNSDRSETYTLRQHQNQGSASINLLGGLPNPPQMLSDAKSFTVGNENVAVPDKDTTYWCRGVRLSDIIDSYDEEKYIVKFSPSIPPGNEAYVHHMLVHICDGLEDSDLGPGGECDDQSDAINRCLGELLIGTWAVGGTDFIYPNNVGYPIGGLDRRQYAVIQIHYNNPEEIAGIVDSSGLTFTYLETPREFDAGILLMGHSVIPRMVIPPNDANYTISAFCSVDCTEEYLPPDGIKIFANILHTHLAGSGLTLSVIRENDDGEYQEIRPVERNLHYDFNFQQTNHLLEEITVLPGDILLLRCYYNTTGRSGVTIGGESTSEEMCLAFPVYYPQVEMNSCISLPSLDQILPFVLEDVPAEYQASFAVLLNDTSGPTIQAVLNQLEWNEKQITSFEEKIYQTGTQLAFCSSDTQFNVTLEQIPDVCCYYNPAKPVRNCTLVETEEPDGASMTHMNAGLLVLLFSSLVFFI